MILTETIGSTTIELSETMFGYVVTASGELREEKHLRFFEQAQNEFYLIANRLTTYCYGSEHYGE